MQLTARPTRAREREIERGGGRQEGLVTARHFGTWQFPPRAHDKNVKFAKGQRRAWGCGRVIAKVNSFWPNSVSSPPSLSLSLLLWQKVKSLIVRSA